MGGALGFASMGNVNGAISGAIGAFVAELAADALYEDPNISNVRAAEKAIERGIPPTKENLAAIIREDMQATLSFAKFAGAFAAFAAGKDPNVAYHMADNAVENNFANFVVAGALMAFDAYEEELEENRDTIIDYVVEKTGLSREVVAASFDGMMFAGKLGNQIADMIPGRSKAKKIAANGVKKVVSAVKDKLSGDGAPTVKPKEGAPTSAEPKPAEIKPTSSTTEAPKKQLLPGEGKVGSYGEQVSNSTKGDNLAAHHIPNDQYMKSKGISKKDGISILVEEPNPGAGGRHREIHKGLPKQDTSLAPRDALAESVQRAREVYKQDGLYPEIRPKLLEVIDQNKTQHPNLFKK